MWCFIWLFLNKEEDPRFWTSNGIDFWSKKQQSFENNDKISFDNYDSNFHIDFIDAYNISNFSYKTFYIKFSFLGI